LELEVVASSGVVSIRGKLTSAEEIKDIERVASAVAGVLGLNLAQLAPAVYA
jgi:osmotically-inducible protein OsmY